MRRLPFVDCDGARVASCQNVVIGRQMIRFVDITNTYWTFPEDPECSRPICAFLDTITDRFLLNTCGAHTCSDLEDVLSLHFDGTPMGERCAGLLPDGFFDRPTEQPVKAPQENTTMSPSLRLEWQRVPSRYMTMQCTNVGEFIAEVRQLEDGTFRAWVRELSCVLRSDSGLASLGVAQAIAEKWLKDIIAKKMDELRALQSVFDDMGLFAVGDVVKASDGSLGIVVAKRGDLIRVVFDDGVRLGIIPNMSLDDAEPIIQHVTPRRRVVVPPELDSHDVELRRMLARDILVNNKGTTT